MEDYSNGLSAEDDAQYSDMSDSHSDSDHNTINILKDSYASDGFLNLKDFGPDLNRPGKSSDKTTKSPFITIGLSSGKLMTVKKSSIWWLLQRYKYKLSTDRLLRVRGTLQRKRKIGTGRKKPNLKRKTKPLTESSSSSSDETVELDDRSSDYSENLDLQKEV